MLPPPGPGNFYPYFTQARVGLACVWEFGNMRNGNTFGGVEQYGSVNPARSAPSPAPSSGTPTASHASVTYAGPVELGVS